MRASSIQINRHSAGQIPNLVSARMTPRGSRGGGAAVDFQVTARTLSASSPPISDAARSRIFFSRGRRPLLSQA